MHLDIETRSMSPDDNPYESPNTENRIEVAKAPWRRRYVAFLLTLGMILLSAALFTMMFNNPMSDKPIYFARMLFGPFGWIFDPPRMGRGDFMSVLITIPFISCYTVYPCCLSGIATLIGVFLWWGCGFVAATGGV
jgi:hypothetical protein